METSLWEQQAAVPRTIWWHRDSSQEKRKAVRRKHPAAPHKEVALHGTECAEFRTQGAGYKQQRSWENREEGILALRTWSQKEKL